ncbi:hypothetical protein ACWDVB_37865, partial [Streptomyces sp. NPDC003379]
HRRQRPETQKTHQHAHTAEAPAPTELTKNSVVSGRPARLQFTDPPLGARHIFIAGVTGSGKGGLVQIVALADHVNGHVIIYGDPKGSSNPDVVAMAAYSGLGEQGSMAALRVSYALMKWRIAESARLGMKNFQATPERPWVRTLLDEAHVPLTELGDDDKREARIILEAMAAKARSLGMPLGIVNQAVNADKLGGSTPLRTNLIQGGSLVLLRTDSDQSNLASTGFEKVDPGTIPATWDVEEPLVFTEDTVLQDPRSTFGLGYTLGPGGVAEMMRTFVLESAAPHVNPEKVAYPADWPDWEYRHEIAETPINDDGESAAPKAFAGVDIPKTPKAKTAAEKILEAIRELGGAYDYVDRSDFAPLLDIEESTPANQLSTLKKKGEVHVQVVDGKEIRGRYALGADASALDQDDDQDAA